MYLQYTPDKEIWKNSNLLPFTGVLKDGTDYKMQSWCQETHCKRTEKKINRRQLIFTMYECIEGIH